MSSAHPADSRIFGHLWTTPEVSALFSDEGRTQAWLDILAALALAQADVGLVPAEAAEAIRAGADVTRLDLDFVAEQTRATGHSTAGLIQALRQSLPAHAREWVYYGATVQDLTDTWFSFIFRVLGDIAERDVARMRDRALGLAAEYRSTPMCGRSHGQPGLPITFGFKAAVWAAELDRHLARIREGRGRWELVQLGGALGTMEFWGEQALDLLDAFARRLGLRAPDVPWLTARDGVAEFIGLLAAISATVGKIGNEVYQLQRPEIGELRERFTPGTVGSITMPHKRNPEISEHLVTLSRIIRAQAGLALDGMVCEHERDGRAWKTEWLVVPETAMAFGVCVASGARMLDGLSVDTERMRRNIDAHRGYLLSEPVLRALADRLGKHTAHDVVYAAAMNGIDAGQDFRTALSADPRLAAISAAELDGLLDVRASLGSCAAFVDRVSRARAGRADAGRDGAGRDGAGSPGAGGREMTAAPDAAGRLLPGRLASRPRADLVLEPTPLHPAPRLSRELGVPVLLKRDDLTGAGLGGNKLRGLEYIIADAREQGCDCLVTGAGPQSNWTMLAALACLRYQIEPHVVCYGTSASDEGASEGNMRLHRWLGVDVRFTGEPDRSSVDAGIEAVTAELRAAGRRPYPVPRGGATPLGALGYVRASVELADQLAALGERPSALWLATGSCGTQAGLLAGAALTGATYDVVGVTVSRPAAESRERVRGLAAEAAALGGIDAAIGQPDVRDGWIGPGYGVPSADGRAAARLVAVTEGVFLDPTFGAKAMAALVAESRAGRLRGTQVFLVSGGAPTLFAGSAP
jgi:adenylosuccinate lyase